MPPVTERRTLKQMCTALSKAIGPGHRMSPAETDRRWQGWKQGEYDPTTGVWA